MPICTRGCESGGVAEDDWRDTTGVVGPWTCTSSHTEHRMHWWSGDPRTEGRAPLLELGLLTLESGICFWHAWADAQDHGVVRGSVQGGDVISGVVIKCVWEL